MTPVVTSDGFTVAEPVSFTVGGDERHAVRCFYLRLFVMKFLRYESALWLYGKKISVVAGIFLSMFKISSV